MRKILLAIVVISVAGCAAPTSKRETYDLMNAEMSKAAQASVQPAKQDAVAAALLPPINIEMPQVRQPLEERFSLAFNNVQASQFFNSIVIGTRYNMLVHPEVSGTISANLKDVTLFEALDAIKDLYGYDYKVEGSRIVIKPLTMQTSIFQVNYLTGNRKGTSDTRVISGSVSVQGQNNGNNANTSNNNNSNSNNSGANLTALESSKISTTSTSDFWAELKFALDAIVGSGKDGRSVVISPQSGVVVIKAMPDELRSVAAYLKATQLSVDRQVILEAKILEVELNDGFQTGVNWSAFRTGSSRISAGSITPGTVLQTGGAVATGASSIDSAARTFSGGALTAVPGQDLVSGASNLGSMFGLALQTKNFAALISFLETQGNVHVLSSPRIATLNNQKAVLKVGTDEFFVTNVSSNITSSGGTAGNTVTPNVTLQPFFSGVVLDVTPQIDEQGNIILHIHPSVSDVQTSEKIINLGTSGGVLTLPLAKSNTSETDSVVRAQDGNIIALGGLMRQGSSSDRSQLPGAGDVPVLGNLFRNTSQATQKRELVILLKPTIIHNASSWAQDILDAQGRIQGMAPRDKVRE
ncbi:pilus (MSHA type) biogenesis protein MshL [Herminiimonas fonticola]|uniref:MSHA biogenesis protein MshL n=1 Tax=Herminiimonas fonticola TaxID=303380 RepID=A0A4R6GIS0_9BURK|nr:pilus (MSHA type) biogenesis protein MshL [Herminiimonas fonticola]RBA25745.1 pilus (MSHA type) biogenesis protein MshL [Herminiimonas fonticola]TDN94853.1 MSHA biogenesis protein MshL [Herminiimonas fonticola]